MKCTQLDRSKHIMNQTCKVNWIGWVRYSTFYKLQQTETETEAINEGKGNALELAHMRPTFHPVS